MKTAPLLVASIASLMLIGCASKKRPSSDSAEVCTPPPEYSLPVTIRPQETYLWCWAASGEMIMDFLGTDVTQCDQANRRLGESDCCGQPAPSDCVKTGWPEFDKYDFAYKNTSDAPRTWAQIKEEIYCKQKPLAFTWRWTGGSGHMMVITGYRTVAGENYVTVLDPLPVNHGTPKTMTYDTYVSGSGYTHWDDYYDVTKEGP